MPFHSATLTGSVPPDGARSASVMVVSVTWNTDRSLLPGFTTYRNCRSPLSVSAPWFSSPWPTPVPPVGVLARLTNVPSDEREYACTALPAVELVIVKTTDDEGGGGGGGGDGVAGGGGGPPAVLEPLLPAQAASDIASAIQGRDFRFRIPHSFDIGHRFRATSHRLYRVGGDDTSP